MSTRREPHRHSPVAVTNAAGAEAAAATRAYKLVRDPELVMAHALHAPIVERFRRLKTVLSQRNLGPLQVIAVTSPVPRDGKSFVAMNLALAMSEDRDLRTLIVDADLRRPTISSFLHPDPNEGLHEVLAGRNSIERVILRPTDSRLHVLPAGTATQESTQLLTSAKCGSLFNALRGQYEKIIVDTPPAVLFSDADAVGACTDGLIMVVRCGETPRQLYTRAIESITSTRIVGTVLNASTGILGDPSSRYDYYNRYYSDQKGGDGRRR